MITGTEPAMPTLEQTGNTECWNTYYGLTIRQHFAAMAMQAILSNQELRIDLLIDARNSKDDLNNCIAKEAVLQADALINELNKTEK
jgi:hypothetical protein